jgi:hypothetical protein
MLRLPAEDGGSLTIPLQYSYFITIPLIMAYAFGYTYIKYVEGYSFIPGHGGSSYPIQWSLAVLSSPRQ